MNRRQVLVSVSSMALSPFVNQPSFAGLSCGPFFNQNGQALQGCTSGINSQVAFMMARSQQNDQWCWAACIQMIFRYFGHDIAQAQIVAETWGSVVNMPASDDQIMQDLNRPWRDAAGNVFDTVAEPVSPDGVALELANNMPLIICTLGHAMVLTAVDYVRDQFGNGKVTNAIVRDPWQQTGRHSLTPQQWYGAQLIVAVRCS